ncbi:FAD:protein FMN transferase [Aneurinibacillus sp. Ricciae_BoGa-3]|uniref:FAD:protein FMN transferase n=1 Tax=Aneurinibacillus sp. Ricciae_BoGa-3 TaxID=3022697 RepID=UPI002341DE13|nr:FAD:protein FMN transferase [Aneurinibacillus sp. Ricciae_BoGa-3]WCK54567.1 FAD:protein FMN transferase [Aneurinibacillus sp. Ricciae_BoGa-3]
MRRDTFKKTVLFMDTTVSITVISSSYSEQQAQASMAKAFEAFRLIETLCSRFDEQSAIMQLSQTINIPVAVNPLLFDAIHFAIEIANLTGGAFDPTVGKAMEERGFNRHYLTGEHIISVWESNSSVSYKDIVLDEKNKTICLKQPLIMDLGAVAKGFAVDLASRALTHFDGFVIDAGGDVFVSGTSERDELWKIGIQHPLNRDETICSVQLSNMAVCTSGSYERKSPVNDHIHHLINPKTNEPQNELVSCTVLAPFAMMADALSTAVFILGKEPGIQLLEESELGGVLISPSLDVHFTKEMENYLL